MSKTIGNPISWAAHNLGATGDHLGESVTQLGSETTAELPEIRELSMEDIRHAMYAGYDDFLASRADALFIAVVYPLAGLVLFGIGLRMDMVPLLAPLIMGFAILGPVAAVGLYEISRRREQGLKVHWFDAFGVLKSPSFGAILILGFYLAALFITWLLTAQAIYTRTLGPEAPVSLLAFATEVITTPAGWTMMISGIMVGFFFALAALALSIVSFPLLLDRKVGVPVAVVTSVRVLRHNPRVVLTWGAIVAALLVIGSIPLLLGLIFVLPLLGHSTWHLYRRAIV